MNNKKICQKCRRVIDLDNEAKFIGVGSGLNNIDIKYYNCNVCDTTLAKLDMPEPTSIEEAIDLIDLLCSSIESNYEKNKK